MPIDVLTGDAAIAEGQQTLSEGVPNRMSNPRYRARVAEAAQIFGRALKGNRRDMLTLQEAMSTSDFPYLLGAVFGRELMATYEQLPKIWPQFASRTTVNDFRAKTLVDLLGGRQRLPQVPQGTEYPATSVSEGTYTLSVAKYGERVPFLWEMIINDDLDALRDLPNRMAQGAADTEDYLATAQLVIAGGPNTAFFKAGNNNAQVTGAGTALSLDAITTGLATIGQRKDSEGRPIAVKSYVLMVPPALAPLANNIVNATEVRVTQGSNLMTVSNWVAGRVKVVENPWIPVIDTSGTVATRWYLLPDPGSQRPAVVLGFLRGHETPDIRVKADTGSRVGGGAIAPEEGSFDIDDIQYRIRHVTGGTTVDPIATYVAQGS